MRRGGFARSLVSLVVVAIALLGPSSGRAALPGANGLIAFDTGGGIAVVRPDGTGLTYLTFGLATDIAPAWSPDGKSIAFTSDRSGVFAIHTMRADGSDVRQVTFPSVGDGWPTWSPNGKQIAFSRSFGNNGAIFTVNVDGSGLRQVTSAGLSLTPAWSPDGSEIAFTGPNGSQYTSIYAVHPDGSGLRRVTRKAAVRDGGPNWSPDGSKILFTRDSSQIVRIGADGSSSKVLAEGVYEMAVYSPDGSRLAIAGNGNLYVSTARGRDPVAIAVPAAKPDWQPAGATCSRGGISGGKTILNAKRSEVGILSYPIHTQAEPLLSSAPQLRIVVHEVNCDAVVTLEQLIRTG
jgi:Tol biopolymer transport system component